MLKRPSQSERFLIKKMNAVSGEIRRVKRRTSASGGSRRLKADQATKDIPVIAVTAHVWEALAQSAGRAGCDGYISKPFNNRQLVLEVQKHLKMPRE